MVLEKTVIAETTPEAGLSTLPGVFMSVDRFCHHDHEKCAHLSVSIENELPTFLIID